MTEKLPLLAPDEAATEAAKEAYNKKKAHWSKQIKKSGCPRFIVKVIRKVFGV